MSTTNVSSPDFKSIADDFKAPDEATQPYQQHLARIRLAFAALDGRWLGVKSVLASLELSADEQTHVNNFDQALTALHSAVLNRATNPTSLEEAPAKDAKPTY